MTFTPLAICLVWTAPWGRYYYYRLKKSVGKQQAQDLKVSGRSGTITSIRNRHRLIKCQMVKIEKKIDTEQWWELCFQNSTQCHLPQQTN